ncbi:MAG: hypothetical protein HY829_10475 [Actinobacteria bacterium]|nr:hypothetical protein [Actinomycetota bacterium]
MSTGPVDADLTEWKRMSALLKTADKKLARETRKALKTVAQPIADKVAAEGAGAMPHRGGLSAYLAANVKPRVNLPAAFGGVSTMTIALQDKKGGVAVKAMDRGMLRHPLFGRRRHWYLQQVPANAWTDSFMRQKDTAVVEVEKAVQETINSLGGAK